MSTLSNYILQDCYGTLLCVIIIACFLTLNKNYGKTIIHLFSLLCLLLLVESVGGTVERYLGNQTVYSSARVFLSWLCYITAPAILLTIIETVLRDYSKALKWSLAIPEFINIAVVSTAFFGPWCFSFEKEINHFVSGPLCIIPRGIVVLYLVVLVISAFANVRKSKWECIIVLISAGVIILNYLNEILGLVPVNLREITIAISMLAYFMYFTAIHHLDQVEEINVAFAEIEEKNTREMVDQSIETLAYTIDAKDRYTKGHSSRVAKYARMIAKIRGKSEEECRKIFLAGLLHDIGKISISDDIINKPGRLTEEEFGEIKKHPIRGARILEKMKSIPFLQDGAKYHHERFDGKGYPSGLKGEEIPELARIIAVADAYDAMTSSRSYRPTMDQGAVKQEIWKGMGTQFDPHFAKIMISIIDSDVDYDFREKQGETDEILFDGEQKEIVWNSQPKEMRDSEKRMQDTDFNTLGAFICSEDHWGKPTKGFEVEKESKTVTFTGLTRPEAPYIWCAPVVLLFSSDDGQVCGPNYTELGVFMAAGYGWAANISRGASSSFTKNEKFESWDNWFARNKEGLTYSVNTICDDDKITVIIENECLTVRGILTIPEKYDRKVYLAIAGERCDISDAQEI